MDRSTCMPLPEVRLPDTSLDGDSIARSFVGVDHGVDIGGGWLVTRHHGCSADVRRCTSAGWSALVESGLLSGDERREVVEGGGPPGLSVVAAGGVGPVAERHPRLGAVVVELHTRDRGLVHAHLGHRVRA
jgi:hypothetical protein